MAMTANRYRHIRAALCGIPDMARLTREHNDANVLVLGADFISEDVALQCLEAFLKTQFLGGSYAEQHDKLTALGGLSLTPPKHVHPPRPQRKVARERAYRAVLYSTPRRSSEICVLSS